MVREATDRPDDELVAAYVRDPEGVTGRAAVDALIARWSVPVYRWAHRIVRDRERALDLAQDSLLQMLGALPRYEPRGRFSAWLFVIVHHRCVAAVRPRSLRHDAEIDADSLPAAGPAPDEAHESAEERTRVFAAIDGVLGELERAALWLRAEEGMSVEEITRVLRLESATGARGLLQTARRKLRAALREGDPA